MNLKRLFSSEIYKGEKGYLKNQLFYEILKTILLFCLSAAVFLIGYFTTGSNKNILTIIAVLGVLPACKCATGMIMFIRYKTTPNEVADRISNASEGLLGSFDMVFTSYDKNFYLNHITVNKGCILGLCLKNSKYTLNEELFSKHINSYLKAENLKDITIKVFTDEKKYLDRLSFMEKNAITSSEENIMKILKSITL